MQLSPNAQEVLCKRYFYRRVGVEQPTCIHCGDQHETIDEFVDRVSMGNEDYKTQLIDPLRFLPNSPTLFNIGVEVDEDNEPVNGGTLSACFKFDVEDTMFDSPDGIMPVMMKAAKVLKDGGGIGLALHVRPEGSLVNSTHRGALGPLGVMRMFHRMALEITQGGKRDAAQMAILHCDHPDLEKFIHAKDKDPDALGTFNMSIAITNEFMEKAIHGDEYASRILDEIAQSAWTTGDPGVFFIDKAEEFNPTPWAGKLTGTNPCGEVPLLRNEPCNLGSADLGKHYDEHTNDVDWTMLGQTIQLATRYLDDVLDRNTFSDPEIRAAAYYTRKLGLGTCGLQDLLVLMGIPYGSDEAVALNEKIHAYIDDIALVTSIVLAEERGYAPCFKDPKAPANGAFPRNATRTCIAPTGTIAIIMNASSGIEPYFALENTRTMGDGTVLIERPWPLETRMDRVPPPPPLVANEIDPVWHIKHQAAAQRHTNLAVSKTINMAESVTPEDIRNAYITMYSFGCKGGTVYRDKSRENQVLVSTTAPKVTTNGWRDELPNERQSLTHKFEIGGVEGYAHIGLFEDGQPAELFLDIAREGSTLSGFADWVGQITSVAWQQAHMHGVPFTVFTDKWIGRKFEPAGMTTNREIPKVDSISDYLGQYLKMRFAGDSPPVQVQSANVCPDCGSILVQQEGCEHCNSCGFERC